MPAFSRGAAHESELWVSRRALDACGFSISMAALYFPDMDRAMHPQLDIQIANVREEMKHGSPRPYQPFLCPCIGLSWLPVSHGGALLGYLDVAGPHQTKEAMPGLGICLCGGSDEDSSLGWECCLSYTPPF